MKKRYFINLAPNEVISRVASSTRKEALFGLVVFSRKSFISKVVRKKFYIYKPPPLFVRNAFVPVLFGQVKGVEGGSKIEVYLSIHPIVKSFMVLTLIFTLIAFSILVAIASVKIGVIFFLLIPIAVLFIARKIGEVLSKSYSKDLVDFFEGLFYEAGIKVDNL